MLHATKRPDRGGYDPAVARWASSHGPRTAAVVLAGGTGSRMTGAGAVTPLPKQLLTIAGRTILEHSVRAFEAAPGIDAVFVLMATDFVAQAQAIVDRAGFRRVRPVLAGGHTRSDSTRIALDLLGDDFDVVLFHDAARPLVEAATIAACLSALADAEAVSVAVELSDTVVVTDGGRIIAIPPRQQLRRLQTPQGFLVPTIRRAHALAAADANFTATDDCGVVLRYLPEVPIRVVAGAERNLKVTHPVDLVIAEALHKTGPAPPG
jgi:ribitol-5-phosphate 2-dehydrogenase (NADP+) / D-ribitol-5-phosphate cytidylyltransferase